jgi:hypothetical protein
MGGGISVKEAPHWQARILALTSPDVPLSLTVAEMPPVFGAVVEALKQTEEGSNTDFSALRAHFREEYGKIMI